MHRYDKESYNQKLRGSSEQVSLYLNYKRHIPVNAREQLEQEQNGPTYDKTDKPEKIVITNDGQNLDIVNYALSESVKEFEAEYKKFDGFKSEWDELSKDAVEELEAAKKAYNKEVEWFSKRKDSYANLLAQDGDEAAAKQRYDELNKNFLVAKDRYIKANKEYKTIYDNNQDLLNNLENLKNG